jgi:hypothetical protein
VITRFRISLLVCFLAVFCAGSADAGFKRLGASGFTILKVTQSARAAGMGDAFAAVSRDASSLFWNPAGLAYIERFEWTYTYTSWIAGSRINSGVFAYRTDFGAIGVSFLSFNPGDIEETTPFLPGGTGRSVPSGDVGIGIGFSRKMTDRFTLGTHVQWVQETLDQDKASTLNVSLGTLFYTGFRSSRVAMTLRNFGKNEKVVREQFFMPMVFTVTGAMEVYGEAQDPNRLTVSFENVFAIDYDNRAHLGAELWLHDRLALRSGYKFNYDTDSFSAGAGVRIPRGQRHLAVDVAYTHMGDLLDPALRVSVGMGF